MKGQEKLVEGGYIETSYTLPRLKAREVARKYFDRYPKEGYDTHIPSWHVTEDGQIFFKIRRLPSCN